MAEEGYVSIHRMDRWGVGKAIQCCLSKILTGGVVPCMGGLRLVAVLLPPISLSVDAVPYSHFFLKTRSKIKARVAPGGVVPCMGDLRLVAVLLPPISLSVGAWPDSMPGSEALTSATAALAASAMDGTDGGGMPACVFKGGG